MGERYAFHCPACGYSAEVSGGGDAGEMVVTTTIVCSTCRELYDIVTLRFRESFDPVDPRCPKGQEHPIAEWTFPGPCPKCGAQMENRGMACLWD